jgi:hypothetical protein
MDQHFLGGSHGSSHAVMEGVTRLLGGQLSSPGAGIKTCISTFFFFHSYHWRDPVTCGLVNKLMRAWRHAYLEQ